MPTGSYRNQMFPPQPRAKPSLRKPDSYPNHSLFSHGRSGQKSPETSRPCIAKTFLATILPIADSLSDRKNRNNEDTGTSPYDLRTGQTQPTLQPRSLKAYAIFRYFRNFAQSNNRQSHGFRISENRRRHTFGPSRRMPS